MAAHDASEALTERLREAGLSAVASAARRAPARLHEALLEAELLGELGAQSSRPAGAAETYRLLIGVLLRDPVELEQLRDRTVWPLVDYDSVHDTELVATLRAFLSTTGRPPRRPRRCGCTATRSATGCRACTRSRGCRRTSRTAASASASGSRPARSSTPSAGCASGHDRSNSRLIS